MKDQGVLVETRSLHHHGGPTSKSSLAALGSPSQVRVERLASATATGTCHVPARYSSHASQHHKRSFASHYYTSSYPSLHALFCGDALLRNGDVIVKRSTQVNKSLSMNRPRAFTDPSLDAVQSIRFPWRRVTPAGEKPTRGVPPPAQVDLQASAGDGAQKDGGDLNRNQVERLGREFAEPRTGVRAKGGTTDSQRSKIFSGRNTNNNIGDQQPTSRPPSGGRRIRSKSCVSRNPSSAFLNPKQRHGSTNSFASAPPLAPPPVRNPSAAPQVPMGSLPKPTRSDRQYKVAFAQSYSAHFPPEERGRMIKTAQRHRTARESDQVDKSLRSDGESDGEDAATPDYDNPDKIPAHKKKPPRNIRTAPVSYQQRSLARCSTVAADSTRHRPLTDGRIGAAILYKEHLRPSPRKTFLSPDQLVVRESVEKVQRWIRTLPRHFDTIQHVLPPVRQDY